jgi:DNA-binding PadR family transcriptional regulator
MRTIKAAGESLLGYALLGLLSQAPRSGYDLRKIFTTTPLAHFSDSPGAVYPALARLRRRGWVAASRRTGGRRRRLFRLTPAGRKAWLGWLRKPPTRAEVMRGMEQLMIRFAFMGEVLPVPAVVRFLELLAQEIDGHVEDLRQYRQRAPDGMSVTGRLAYEAGVSEFEAVAAWARRARAVVLKGEEP